MKNLIGKQIQILGRTFTVKAVAGSIDKGCSGGISIPEAFKEYGPSLIGLKRLENFYFGTGTNIYKKNILRGSKLPAEIVKEHESLRLALQPIPSKFMAAYSEIPLGELEKENGKLYIKKEDYECETRMYLFSEAQARQIGIDLKRPAFIMAEHGYEIADEYRKYIYKHYATGYSIVLNTNFLGKLSKNSCGNLKAGNIWVIYPPPNIVNCLKSFQTADYHVRKEALPLEVVGEKTVWTPIGPNRVRTKSMDLERNLYYMKPGPLTFQVDGVVIIGSSRTVPHGSPPVDIQYQGSLFSILVDEQLYIDFSKHKNQPNSQAPF